MRRKYNLQSLYSFFAHVVQLRKLKIDAWLQISIKVVKEDSKREERLSEEAAAMEGARRGAAMSIEREAIGSSAYPFHSCCFTKTMELGWE
ncbi:hypothetical protein HPP92_008586 [Vanilla planifolia]|uniref:Uncharacterized protein n=1 Tax=Vanilla planifolia TaxID=51239 RepID=A0A835V3X1_VANPL|nr:hypothetical protein HPP92_008586 [Vanilla planifolia]